MDSPTLTTMVVLYTMGVRLNTDILAQTLPLTKSVIKVEKQGVVKRGSSKRDLIKRRTKTTPPKRTTGFGHNSITVVLMSDGNGKFPRNNLRFYCNGSYNNIGSLYPSINTWNHYVWTLDTNNNNRIYINNVLKDTSTTPTYASFRLDNNSILGDKGLRANGQQGNIDDFRYYDGVLTPDQVSQLYSMRNP
jgi:hypothetical protein